MNTFSTSDSPSSMGEDGDSAIGGDTTSSTSPDFRINSDDFSDEREENFECFGENDNKEYDSDLVTGKTTMTEENKMMEDRRTSPDLAQRISWQRTSLRRPSSNKPESLVPPKRWGSFRTPRHGTRSSAALATALFNSGPATNSSFNSSGRSSNCDEGDIQDLHSDISIEDDVIDLNNKVQQLQDQVGVLAENQASTDDRYTRVKQDNTALTARIHIFEEHVRELEVRGEEKLEEEKRRNTELLQRIEREKVLEIENYTIRLSSAGKEARVLTEEVSNLRDQLEKVNRHKLGVENQLTETQVLLTKEQRNIREMADIRTQEKEEWSRQRDASNIMLQDMTGEVEELRRDKLERVGQMESNYESNMAVEEVFNVLPTRIGEMESEIRVLRDQNKRFQENNEELQAQMLNKGLEEGRTLLLNQAHNNSLAAEFEAMSENEMKKALKDQQDVNLHLSGYIDNVLLNIMEKYPELLEIRNK